MDLSEFIYPMIKLVVAFLLTFPIAWEREQANRIMGLRTFPLVAVASCAYVLVAVSIVGADKEANARIIQGLMTGIGFVGGGAILKQSDQVRGTATATSVWSTGAVGAAVAYGRYELAAVVCLATFLVLRLLTPAKDN